MKIEVPDHSQTELPPMTPAQITRFIAATLIPMQQATGLMRPLMLYGPPGIGKSAIPYEAAKQTGRKLIEDRANTWDICDVRGALDVIEGKNNERVTVWARPNTFPTVDDGPCIFFVDEVPQALQPIQTTLFGLTAPPYKIADYHLPTDCTMILAGNRPKDGSAANAVPAALRNRFINVEMVASNSDWTTWALGADIELPVIAFLNWRPQFLNAFDPKPLASPTPRSWEILSNTLATGLDKEIELPAICGIVGRVIGTEFYAFLKVWRQIPNPDQIFNDPTGADVPSEPSALYALATALGNKVTGDNFDRVTAYAKRLPPEFGELLVQESVRMCPDATHTRAYVEWVAKKEEAA